MAQKEIQPMLAALTRNGITAKFEVQNPSDLIQNHHAKGEFYEEEELELTREWVGKGTRVVDVGANVGNHVVFWSVMCGAEVVAIEPNPQALGLLHRNLDLNGLGRVPVLGCALGMEDGFGGMSWPECNLGGATWVAGPGPLRMLKGDALQLDPEFLKIDVEGLEGQVLRGLRDTIAEWMPVIMIEWSGTMRALGAWCRAEGYSVERELRRRHAPRNFILTPD